MPIDPEACWKLLERVAASSHLNRAPRLREFLFYVGKKSIKDGSIEVHEQEIGSAVFGRELHYDTSQDNIVRVNATELRKRIDAYFISDGVNEVYNFRIPRGSYKPVFRRNAPAPEAGPAAELLPLVTQIQSPQPIAIVPSARVAKSLTFVATTAVVVLLTLTSLLLWRDNHSLRMALHPWRSQPALADLWSNFLGSNGNTDVILADTSFALVQDLSGKSYSLSDYLGNSYLSGIQASNISADRRADLTRIASRRNGSMGDFGVAEKIKSLDPNASNISMAFAREYTADEIKKNNTVLIGSRKSNPWVDLFSDRMNFVIEYNPTTKQSLVRNRKPRPGEQSEYDASLDPSPSNGYSIIAFLPNPSHTAKSLIIEGTTSQATNAAGEFIASEDSLRAFQKRFPGGHFSYFEILLKTTQFQGTPFKAELLTYRIY